MNQIIQQALFIGQGLSVSFIILLGGIGIGISLGTILSLLRYNRWGNFVIDGIISLFRGTPLLLQLSFFYFIIPQYLGLRLDAISCGILTFGLNSSAYVAEIIRAGIESIPQGQFEAARTLHIPSFYLWKDIILPQVLKNVLPALANEATSLLKESALISTIGGMDIMKRASIITSQQLSYFTPLCIVGAYYYILVMGISYISSALETKEDHAHH